jgi:hypothetical protein
LSPALRGDLAKIVSDAPRLVNGMIGIVQQASRGGVCDDVVVCAVCGDACRRVVT